MQHQQGGYIPQHQGYAGAANPNNGPPHGNNSPAPVGNHPNHPNHSSRGGRGRGGYRGGHNRGGHNPQYHNNHNNGLNPNMGGGPMPGSQPYYSPMQGYVNHQQQMHHHIPGQHLHQMHPHQHPGYMHAQYNIPPQQQYSQRPGPGTSAAAPQEVRAPPVRERKVLEIIDPRTQKPIAAMAKAAKKVSSPAPAPAVKEEEAQDKAAVAAVPETATKPDVKQETPALGGMMMFGDLPAADPVVTSKTCSSPSTTPAPAPVAAQVSTPKKSPASISILDQVKEQLKNKKLKEEQDKISAAKPAGPEPVSTDPAPAATVAEKVEEPKPQPKKAATPKAKKRHEMVEEEEEEEEELPLPKLGKKSPSGKLIFTLLEMCSVRMRFQSLPKAALEEDSGWEDMSVLVEKIEGREDRRGGRGRNQSTNSQGGWERGAAAPPGQLQRKGSTRHRQDGGGGGNGSEWKRSQDLPRRQSSRGGRGGRGSRGSYYESEYDGPVKPLNRTDNRWKPLKAKSNLEESIKIVQGIMNKMTREKFGRLSAQLCALKIESMDMLRAVINLIFDKALGEPHFCDMYADLCLELNKGWQVWDFLKTVRNDEEKMHYWTVLSGRDAEVIGPFSEIKQVVQSIDTGEIQPIPAPKTLELHQLKIRSGMFIKVWIDLPTAKTTVEEEDEEEEEEPPKFYWSGERISELTPEHMLRGKFASKNEALLSASKQTSFKRFLLNNCQIEFQKELLFEELEKNIAQAKARIERNGGKEIVGEGDAKLEDLEEQRFKMKRRMLGNIRFIGELFKKAMLSERIMHECIFNLLDCNAVMHNGKLASIEPKHPKQVADEESLESLSKLLATIGKSLEVKCKHELNIYFKFITRLSNDKRIGTRIRFMLKDTMDLRVNHWTPRRKELKQKTLEEIRKDAEKEEIKSQRERERADTRGRLDSRHSYRAGDHRQRNLNPRNSQPQEHGDHHHHHRNSRNNNPSSIPQVYQSSRNNNSNNSSSSSAAANSFQRVGCGGRSSKEEISLAPRSRPTFGNNSKRGSGLGSSRNASSDQGKSPQQTPRPLAATSHTTTESVSMPNIDTSLMKKKVLSIIDEYIELKDLAEAQACLKEVQESMGDEVSCRAVIQHGLVVGLEKKDKYREGCLALLTGLYHAGVLGLSDIQHGLVSVLLISAELIYDVPKIHMYVGDYIRHFLAIEPQHQKKSSSEEDPPSSLTLEWLLSDCLDIMSPDQWQELSSLFLKIVHQTLVQSSADQIKACTSEMMKTQVSCMSLLRMGETQKSLCAQMTDWASSSPSKNLVSVLGLDSALEIAQMLQQQSEKQVLDWIVTNVSMDQRQNVCFAKHVFYLMLEPSQRRGEVPSSGLCDLLRGFCGALEQQQACLSVLTYFPNLVKGETEMLKLFQFLYEEQVICMKAAFEYWLASSSSSAQNKSRGVIEEWISTLKAE